MSDLDFKPINVESKTGMNLQMQGRMTSQDTKEVAQILANETGRGLKWLLILVGVGLCAVLVMWQMPNVIAALKG